MKSGRCVVSYGTGQTTAQASRPSPLALPHLVKDALWSASLAPSRLATFPDAIHVVLGDNVWNDVKVADSAKELKVRESSVGLVDLIEGQALLHLLDAGFLELRVEDEYLLQAPSVHTYP